MNVFTSPVSALNFNVSKIASAVFNCIYELNTPYPNELYLTQLHYYFIGLARIQERLARGGRLPIGIAISWKSNSRGVDFLDAFSPFIQLAREHTTPLTKTEIIELYTNAFQHKGWEGYRLDMKANDWMPHIRLTTYRHFVREALQGDLLLNARPTALRRLIKLLCYLSSYPLWQHHIGAASDDLLGNIKTWRDDYLTLKDIVMGVLATFPADVRRLPFHCWETDAHRPAALAGYSAAELKTLRSYMGIYHILAEDGIWSVDEWDEAGIAVPGVALGPIGLAVYGSRIKLLTALTKDVNCETNQPL